jgi:hypothetical protein
MYTKCPESNRYTVKMDSYFKRDACIMRDCSWVSKGFKNNDINQKKASSTKKKVTSRS